VGGRTDYPVRPGSKQAHRVIHKPVSVVLQCWLVSGWRPDNGDQRRPTESDSALEACSRRRAIQIHV